jgi:hypothetical protein
VRAEPRIDRVPTPLSGANRRADRARHRVETGLLASTGSGAPRPERSCKRCGGRAPAGQPRPPHVLRCVPPVLPAGSLRRVH